MGRDAARDYFPCPAIDFECYRIAALYFMGHHYSFAGLERAQEFDRVDKTGCHRYASGSGYGMQRFIQQYNAGHNRHAGEMPGKGGVIDRDIERRQCGHLRTNFSINPSC